MVFLIVVTVSKLITEENTNGAETGREKLHKIRDENPRKRTHGPSTFNVNEFSGFN